MKKIALFLLLISFLQAQLLFSQTEQLKRVTFGIGTGFSVLFDHPYEYTLSPDESHTLQDQKLSKWGFVISSVITIKFGKLGIESPAKVTEDNQNLLNLRKSQVDKAGIKTYSNASFWNRFSLNVALNLLEVNSENLSFNKSIDGGIGLGYFANEFTQVAFFIDLIRIRQLKDYIRENYLGKPIPNGAENYNALDVNDNSLFYNKHFGGISFKVIFSLGNRN